jgi:hypothetical protein
LKKIGTVSNVALSLIVGNESIPIEKIADAGDIIQLKDEYAGLQAPPQSKPVLVHPVKKFIGEKGDE